MLFLQSSVLLPVVLTLIATRPQDGQILKILANVCYPKWALEAFVIANAERYCTISLSQNKVITTVPTDNINQDATCQHAHDKV